MKDRRFLSLLGLFEIIGRFYGKFQKELAMEEPVTINAKEC